MPLDQGDRSLIFYFERGRDGALRLAELGKDEFDFRWGERAAAQVTEMRESRIDGDPLTELVPGCLRAELGKVLKGELRAPERSDVLFHIVLVFV
jgi:hypothetical protein